MQLTLTPGKIILFAVIIGIIEILKFLIFIWFGSSLAKISRYTKHSALKMNQLCKLTSDAQIISRGTLNELKIQNSPDGKLPEEAAPVEIKKPRKKRSSAKAEENEAAEPAEINL